MMGVRIRVAFLTILGTAAGFGHGFAQTGPPSGSDVSFPSIEEMAGWAEEGEAGVERVRSAVLARVTALPSERATIWVQLLSVIEAVDPSVAPVAIRAVGLGIDSQAAAGSELLLNALQAAPVSDRAALLSLAAQIADAGDSALAGEIRDRLLEEHPDAPEATEARLVQAGWYLADGDRPDDGLRLLEELIVGSPQHPLAPEARRLYQANGGRGGSGPGSGAG